MPLFDLQQNLVKTGPEVVQPVSTPLTFLPSVSSDTLNGNPIDTTKIGSKTKTDPQVDKSKLLDYYLGQVKSDNAPEYYYGTKQEERYDDPFLQFTPNIQGASDTEEVYAKYQGAPEKIWNSLVKTGATVGSTFLSTFSGIPNQINSIRQGKVNELFEEDSTLGSTQRWLENLENKYPNYYTQWERDHPYQSGFNPFGGGLSNFWGDKVLKNAGFTIGGLGAALATDAAIEFATAGVATPATLILAGKQLSNIIRPLKNAFRGLSKASLLNKVDDVYHLAETSGNMVEGIKAANYAYNLKKAGQFALTLYSSAQGEAMIEGYHTYINTKTDLLQKALDEGKELTPELLSSIEENASYAGRDDTIINLALLSASSLIQFPKIVGWAGKSDILKKLDAPFLEIVRKEGLEVANNWTRKQATKNILKGVLLKGVLPEGLEEGSQYYVGNSLHDYYIDKFNGKAKDGMVNYLLGAVPKTLADSQFWQESFLGALSGGIMGSVLPGGEIKNTIKRNSNSYNEKYRGDLQKTLDTFNNSVKDLTHLGELIEHGETGTGTEKFQTSYKALFSTVRDAAKYGVLDSLKENLEELRHLPVEEYNKLFYQDPTNNPEILRTEGEKLSTIEKISKEVNNIEKDLIEIEKFYSTNPFTSNQVAANIKSKFKVDKVEDLKSIQEKLFSDFKENTAYQVSRLRNTAGRIEDIKNEIRLGSQVTSESFNQMYLTLTNLSDQKSVNQYLRFKNIQLDSLKRLEDYYDELNDSEKSLEVGLSIKRIEKLKQDLSTSKFDTKEQQDQVSNLILIEELGANPTQIERILEQLREAQEQESIRENTEQELEIATNEPEIIAQAQVDLVDEMINPEPEEIIPEPETGIPEFEPPKSYIEEFDKVRSFKEGQTFILDEDLIGTKEFTVLVTDDSDVTVLGGNGKYYSFDLEDIREINPSNGNLGEKFDYGSFINFNPVLKGQEPLPEPVQGKNQITQDRNRLQSRLDKLKEGKSPTTNIREGTFLKPNVLLQNDNAGWYYREFRFTKKVNNNNLFDVYKVYLDQKSLDGRVALDERIEMIPLTEQKVEPEFIPQVTPDIQPESFYEDNSGINTEEINKQRLDLTTRKSSAEEQFNFVDSLPEGTIFEHSGDTRVTVPKKQIYKNGTEGFTFVPEIWNEETNTWEVNNSGIVTLDKKSDGTYQGELPGAMKNQSFTNLEGERRVSEPNIILPQGSVDDNITRFMRDKKDSKELYSVLLTAINSNQFEVQC